jgi:electron transfer flavoprotein alpha subunit
MSEAPRKKRKVVIDAALQAYRGVWVYIEHERGRLHPVSLELLGEGRKLADQLGVELAGVVLTDQLETGRDYCRQAFEHGAELCYLMHAEVLGAYRNQPYSQGLCELVERFQPEILLLGATPLGRDLAGSVATSLETGLTADCTALAIDPDDRGLLATRPTFGGSLMCTIVTLNYRPQMATVRPRVLAMPQRQPGRSGRIVELPLQLAEHDIVSKVLAFIADDPQIGRAHV